MKRSLGWLILAGLVVSVAVLSFSTTSSAQVAISVRIGPPALPIYAQPMCPGPGYFWTPGYWAWSDYGGYYWVPGTWVVAPVSMLWTPGYWGWREGFYFWHPGYWGRHVGFYGGINYGYGYGGSGFYGGEWRGNTYFYNRSVVNVVNITNVYNRTVVVNNSRNVSFNGPGGIEARPTREEEAYEREPHNAALSRQMEHERAAGQNRRLFASENHGRPEIAATPRAGEFSGRNIERARAAGEPYHPPKISPQEARGRAEDDRRSREPARNESNFGRNPEPRNDHGLNRGQMSSRENSNVNRQEREAQKREMQAQKEQRQAEKQAQAEQRRSEKANREQPHGEHKRNAHEPPH
jgi:hypothetical protein